MSLAAPDSLLVPPAVNARRRLHRRSSCSSIPRSVSACSSVWAFDLSSEDLRVPADPGEVETYMAPLFRGLEGLREVHDETAKPVSATHPDGFNKSPPCDDSRSENLSNYHFDIAGHDHDGSEQPNPSEVNPSLERSPAPSQQVPPVVPKPQSDRPVRRQPLPAQAPPAPVFPRPLVLVEAVRQDPPITGTRPLRIDRSKKRQELGGGGSQRTPRTDAPYVRPPARSIHRAATQVNLREAYRRASPHSADRVGQTRLIPVARPPPLGPLPEIPDSSVNKVVPVATLFPTGLIPLQHAQDKFRHAHCLDRLPPPTLNRSDIANPPTPSSGNRSPRTLGWSFGRAFRKQKA